MSSIPDANPSFEEELRAGAEALEEVEGESTQPERGTSLAEAFAEAERKVFGEQADEGEEQPEGATQPADQEQGAQQAQRQRPQAIESELDRIITHVKRGNLDALPPEVRGRVAALERELAQRVQAQSQQESQLRQEFLKLEALRIEDPDRFSEFIAASPDNAQLYHSLKAAFPNLTPDGDELPLSPEKVRENTLVEVFSDMLTAISEATGLHGQELDAVKTQSAGPWDFLQRAIKAAVERELAAIRAKVAAEEAKAAKQEAQAEMLAGRVVVPRDLPAYTSQAGSQGPIDIRTAAEIAERLIGR